MERRQRGKQEAQISALPPWPGSIQCHLLKGAPESPHSRNVPSLEEPHEGSYACLSVNIPAAQLACEPFPENSLLAFACMIKHGAQHTL